MLLPYIDFTPEGSSTSPRSLSKVEDKIVTSIDLETVGKRLQIMFANLPKFARLLQSSSYDDILWAIGRTNGPMAGFARKHLGFLSIQLSGVKWSSKAISENMEQETLAIPMEDIRSGSLEK
jgi:hypothetical protein